MFGKTFLIKLIYLTSLLEKFTVVMRFVELSGTHFIDNQKKSIIPPCMYIEFAYFLKRNLVRICTFHLYSYISHLRFSRQLFCQNKHSLFCCPNLMQHLQGLAIIHTVQEFRVVLLRICWDDCTVNEISFDIASPILYFSVSLCT